MTHQKPSSDETIKTSHQAQGRLRERQPIAVIDIGSNSVRQVVYEGFTRSPSVLFNEKILCGLGRGVAASGRMDENAVEAALRAISRYFAIGKQLGVVDTHIIATAAVREAKNGPAFIKQVEKVYDKKLVLLSGKKEALYAGWGIESGFYQPDGIVGDLGGGSLELINVKSVKTCENEGVTMPLGGLRLTEMAEGNFEKAREIVHEHFSKISDRADLKGRTFYAVGGTWRSLAKLHMAHIDYPLFVLHDYTVNANTFIEFCESLIEPDPQTIAGMDMVSKNRRNLLPIGAIVLIEALKFTGAKQVSISSLGVREGYLHALLDKKEQQKDPLIEASRELAILRARSPHHAEELANWTKDAFAIMGIEETANEARYRTASCYLADIAWRAHSDYQAKQSLGIISNAGFVGISHMGRAYLAISNYCRYSGLSTKNPLPEIVTLADERTIQRARVLAALFRLLYLYTASIEGIIPQLKLKRGEDRKLRFILPGNLSDLAGERPDKRMEQLAREIGEPIELTIGN
ncbi:MAG: Ppx/GppA phosphatase family protein [Rhizobiaceae bacterium]